MTAASITYDLNRKPRFAMTTTLIGIFLGVAIAQVTGGSFGHQLILAALIATIVSGSSYCLLCRLARAATGGSGYYRIPTPNPEDIGKSERAHELDEPNSSDDSTLVDIG